MFAWRTPENSKKITACSVLGLNSLNCTLIIIFCKAILCCMFDDLAPLVSIYDNLLAPRFRTLNVWKFVSGWR